MRQKWEYKLVDVSVNLASRPGEQVELTLNELGEQGWELVAVLRNGPMEPTRLYLKRQRD